MKKFVLVAVLLLSGSISHAMYDFCESPSDYNTFPQAYDVRTEYWKDIPEYQPNNIKFENMENEHPVFPAIFKKKTKNLPQKELDK